MPGRGLRARDLRGLPPRPEGKSGDDVKRWRSPAEGVARNGRAQRGRAPGVGVGDARRVPEEIGGGRGELGARCTAFSFPRETGAGESVPPEGVANGGRRAPLFAPLAVKRWGGGRRTLGGEVSETRDSRPACGGGRKPGTAPDNAWPTRVQCCVCYVSLNRGEGTRSLFHPAVPRGRDKLPLQCRAAPGWGWGWFRYTVHDAKCVFDSPRGAASSRAALYSGSPGPVP